MADLAFRTSEPMIAVNVLREDDDLGSFLIDLRAIASATCRQGTKLMSFVYRGKYAKICGLR
jgi:hypothetical protein